MKPNIGLLNIGSEEFKGNEIIKETYQILNDKKFLNDVKYCINPYGDGRSANRIMNILKKINIGNNIIQKRITY